LRVIFRKDIYTEEYLRGLGLNERQMRAIAYIREKGKITNEEYKKINKVSKATATKDLRMMVDKLLIVKKGTTGRGTEYHLRKGLTKG